MSIPVYHILESNGVTHKKRHGLISCLIKNTSIHRRGAKYTEKTMLNIKAIHYAVFGSSILPTKHAKRNDPPPLSPSGGGQGEDIFVSFVGKLKFIDVTLSLPACREIRIAVNMLIHDDFGSYRCIHQVLVKHVHHSRIQSVRNSHCQEYTG